MKRRLPPYWSSPLSELLTTKPYSAHGRRNNDPLAARKTSIRLVFSRLRGCPRVCVVITPAPQALWQTIHLFGPAALEIVGVLISRAVSELLHQPRSCVAQMQRDGFALGLERVLCRGHIRGHYGA